jgi:hypothetical protein
MKGIASNGFPAKIQQHTNPPPPESAPAPLKSPPPWYNPSMSEGQANRVRLVLGFLILIGVAVTGWGLIAPMATGSAFAEAVIDELGLPKDNPETWEKLTAIYAKSIERRAAMTSIVGLFILVPATIGLWTIGANYHDPRP